MSDQTMHFKSGILLREKVFHFHFELPEKLVRFT